MAETALYDLHVKSGARLDDFYDWQMPQHYGSAIDEHMHVRADAGLFDLSHMMIIDINGAGCEQFLRHLLSIDVRSLYTVGQAKYSLMLNLQGGIIDDLIVYRMPMGYRLVTNCATRKRIKIWLEQQHQALGVPDINIRYRKDLSLLSMQGPKAFVQLFQLIYTQYEGDREFGLLHAQFEHAKDMTTFQSRLLGDIHLSRTGYTGEAGVEIILPHKLAVRLWSDLIGINVQPCGLVARDSLRLEAGLASSGQDMDETTRPNETRLNWALDLSDPKRDFIGRELSQTTSPRFVTRSFVLRGRGIPQPQQGLFAPNSDKQLGEVISGTFSPSLKLGIGFARMPPKRIQDLEIELRQGRQSIALVQGPFVRDNEQAYKLVQ